MGQQDDTVKGRDGDTATRAEDRGENFGFWNVPNLGRW
jgi:hypothetical protein